MLNKMAYLGPPGTFCEEAASLYTDQIRWELLPCTNIEQVFAAVHSGDVDSGIVPMENSCEGSVNQTMDLLAYEYDLLVTGEIILPIEHNLLVKPGLKAEDISCILSHPQALAQCRNYLNANFGDLVLIDTASTADAARRVAGSNEPWAAIGTPAAARCYGLAILGSAIQDRYNNETRFIVLSKVTDWDRGTGLLSHMGEGQQTCPSVPNNQARQPSPCLPGNEQNNKTSLLIYLLNKPGALFQALELFYRYGINLTKIESRPARTRIGEYLFFIDIEGHQLDHQVITALKGLTGVTDQVRVLGSYRAAGRPYRS